MEREFPTLRMLVCFFFTLALSCNINAKEEISDKSYDAIFFLEYSPQTAMDMVLRLPGFVFIEADSDIRGFAGGSGNVLINGARPITKSGGLKEALSRIPASHVERIEVLRGKSGTADTGGKAIVANVIKKKSESAKRWQLAVEAAEGQSVSPEVELALTKQLGEWEGAAKLTAQSNQGYRQSEIKRLSGEQLLLQTQLEDRPSELNEWFVSADLKRQSLDQAINVNSRFGWSQFVADTDRNTFMAEQFASENQQLFSGHRDSQYYTAELGLDWHKQLNRNWQLQVVNLNNSQNWFVQANSANLASGAELISGSQMRFDEHNTENIVRATLSSKSSTGEWLSRQEYGIEIAISSMESWLKLWDVNETINPTPFHNTYVKVEEIRTQGFANLSWELGDFIAETGLSTEYSELDVQGSSQDRQYLFFAKPSFALTYSMNEKTQYRFSLTKSVGQLNFSDFAASADLTNDREFSGNSRLRPDTNVKAEFSADFRYSENGAVSLVAYKEWRKDVLENIALPSGGQMLGNAGDANVEGLEVNATVPLQQWIRQATLTLVADYVKSDFTDPITGKVRELSWLDTPNITLDFRQDFPEQKISWGFGYLSYQRSESYFVNESNFYRTKGNWNLFIEKVMPGKTKIRLAFSKLGKERESWTRNRFQTNRADALLYQEITERERQPAVKLTVSRTF